MPKSSIPKLLKVTWLDSWTSMDEAGLYDYSVKTVGFYSKEDKNYLQLSQNLNNDGEPSAPFMNINKKWIQAKEVI